MTGMPMTETKGFLYLASSSDKTVIKIGITTDPARRLMCLRTQLRRKFKKREMQFLAVWPMPIDDARVEEAILLREFRDLSILCEWHLGHPDLLALAGRPGSLDVNQFKYGPPKAKWRGPTKPRQMDPRLYTQRGRRAAWADTPKESP